jgi:hypothetical protein
VRGSRFKVQGSNSRFGDAVRDRRFVGLRLRVALREEQMRFIRLKRQVGYRGLEASYNLPGRSIEDMEDDLGEPETLNPEL